MKKTLLWTLLVVLICLLCLSACGGKGEISAEKWKEVLNKYVPNENVTIKSEYFNGTETETIIAKLDLNRKKFSVVNGSEGNSTEEFYSVENDELYCYAKNDDGKWERYIEAKADDDPLGAKSFIDALKERILIYWLYFPTFKDSFELFEYDSDLKQYVAQGNELLLFSDERYEKAVYRFADEKPVYVEMQFAGNEKMVFEMYDYNVTKVSLPKDYVIS